MGYAHGLCRFSSRCTSIHASQHDNTTGIGKGIGLRIRSLQAYYRPWTVYRQKEGRSYDEVIFEHTLVLYLFRRVCTYG